MHRLADLGGPAMQLTLQPQPPFPAAVHAVQPVHQQAASPSSNASAAVNRCEPAALASSSDVPASSAAAPAQPRPLRGAAAGEEETAMEDDVYAEEYDSDDDPECDVPAGDSSAALSHRRCRSCPRRMGVLHPLSLPERVDGLYSGHRSSPLGQRTLHRPSTISLQGMNHLFASCLAHM